MLFWCFNHTYGRRFNNQAVRSPKSILITGGSCWVSNNFPAINSQKPHQNMQRWHVLRYNKKSSFAISGQELKKKTQGKQ